MDGSRYCIEQSLYDGVPCSMFDLSKIRVRAFHGPGICYRILWVPVSRIYQPVQEVASFSEIVRSVTLIPVLP